MDATQSKSVLGSKPIARLTESMIASAERIFEKHLGMRVSFAGYSLQACQLSVANSVIAFVHSGLRLQPDKEWAEKNSTSTIAVQVQREDMQDLGKIYSLLWQGRQRALPYVRMGKYDSGATA